ncbi:hypothetical protein BKH42_03710 [Helicobacter sp. 13S00482-2]|uniref:hypothetical protein n=1 Tax=Helicobacter sp. 13S00482-2 TaxID=1476200 RepID=UPI000BA6025E|nr:hypothetical protein [Helicobacter sp. 13S00482-2]PAF53848.1 hypothetical protein BKH42_03710 [Helicobacter sp. 13S00482-2]
MINGRRTAKSMSAFGGGFEGVGGINLGFEMTNLDCFQIANAYICTIDHIRICFMKSLIHSIHLEGIY